MRTRTAALLASTAAAAIAVTAVAYFARPQAPHPHVLVVTIDTLRDDAVGDEFGTPALAAFARAGARFRGARTVTPLTLPAHVSLFSGLAPARTGVHDNATPPLPPRDARGFPLLAEEFADAGYATAAFVARRVLRAETGIAAGFATFDEPAYDDPRTGGYMPADARVDAAVAWLRAARANGAAPAFCWVHLFDPHAPYRPWKGDGIRRGSDAHDTPRARYAGEVRRVDAAVARLLDAVGDDWIVVIASDHGEGLGEHGEPTHGPLCYASTADVFLAVRAPAFAPGSGDAAPRGLCDVAPSLRAWCGLDDGAPADGARLDGPARATVVTESLYTWRIHGWGQVFAVTDGRYSLVETGPRVELFDRASDPRERHPLRLRGHPAYERLDRALEAYRTSDQRLVDGEALGSVAPYGTLRRPVTAYLPRTANARLPDPRRLLRAWGAMAEVPALLQSARERSDLRRVRDVLALLEDLGERTPRSPHLHHLRAQAFATAAAISPDPAWLRRAAAAQVEAIAAGYVVSAAVVGAVSYAARAGDPELAEQALRIAGDRGFVPDEPARRVLAEAARVFRAHPAVCAAVDDLLTRGAGAASSPRR